MPAPLYDRLLKTYALAWVMLVLGLCLTAVAAWSLFAKVRALDENRFHRQVGQTVETLRDRIDKYELALAGLADFAASRPSLTRAEWNFRVRLLQPEKGYAGLLELGLLEAVGSEPAEPGKVKEVPGIGTSAAETNTFHLQHAWVSPPSAFDGLSPQFLSEPSVQRAALLAFRTGVPTRCYLRELATEIAGKPARGLTIFVPFMEPRQEGTQTNHLSPGGREASGTREARSQGIVFGSIEPNLLLGNLFGTAPREVGFDLFSGQPLSAQTWLNVSGKSPPTLAPGFRPYLRATIPLQLRGEDWTLLLYTTSLFEKESSRYRPWTAIIVGTILSFLVAALLFVQIRSRVRQEAIAAELRSACDDLQQVQNERERIGRDIHDGAIQSLYGLQLSLGHYERLRASDAETAGKVFDRCRQAIDALIAELRTFIVQQLPEEEASAAPSSPATTLKALVQRIQSASPIPIELVISDPLQIKLSFADQVHLRQIAQESLSNSLRHAQPRQIKVEFQEHMHHLRLCVSDDGRGFDVAQSHPSGRGLANMQARALQLGGVLTIQTQPARGTKVILDLPIRPQTAASHE